MNSIKYLFLCLLASQTNSQKYWEAGYLGNEQNEDTPIHNGAVIDEKHFKYHPRNTDVNKDSNIGNFWHISDLHLDFYYDHRAAPKSVCPSSNGVDTIAPGIYGDYRCDSPWALINSSIYAMKQIQPHPDFILWTGDDTLHTNDEDKYLSEDLVVQTIKNLTILIQEVFPNVKIYTAFGNHDYHPKNQMPAGESSLLSKVADMWFERGILDALEYATFYENGYYVGSSDKYPDLQVLVLNTNLWYSSNKLINETANSDPGGQFEWLESVLANEAQSSKYFIIGHIPPGYFELVDYKYWLYETYNNRFISLVKKYSNKIVGQFFGHHHTDSFRLFNDEYDNAVSSIWIAPGVSPWMTTLPGVKNGANNPGIRMFEFDKSTLVPKDYLQYYLDLEKANADDMTQWMLEYRATTTYEMEDISPRSMGDLYKKLKEADPSCEDCKTNQLLQKFALFNTVSYNKAHCDFTCQRLHVCAISELKSDDYSDCVKVDGNAQGQEGGGASQIKVLNLLTILTFCLTFLLTI